MRAPGGGAPRRRAGRESSTGNELAAAGSARNAAYGPLPTAMRPSSRSANQLAWPLPLQFRTLAHDDPDPVPQRPVVALHEIEKALRRADDDGSGRLGGAEEHQLSLVRGGQPLLVRIRHDAGLLLDGQFLGLQAHGTLRPRLLAGSPARQEPPDA